MYKLGVVSRFIIVALLVVGTGFSNTAGASSVDNFRFESFHADYYLSKDDESRSSVKVVETLVAIFPDYNQNKGIYRSIPYTYDGHSISINLVSLTRNGNPEPVYSEEKEKGHLIIATGNNSYVTGRQSYQFTYTMHDVTKDFSDGQEFYWDVNGFDWKQSFGEVSATVHLDDSVASDFTGRISCYKGAFGSNTPCGSASLEGNTVQFSSDGPIRPRSNLTFALQFNKDTFAQYDEGLIGDLRPYFVGGAIAFGVAMIAWAGAQLKRIKRQAKGRGIIVPEYLPPKDSMLMTAGMLGRTDRYFPAQVISLAVEGFVRIIETQKPGFFGKTRKVYEAELIHTEGLDADSYEFVKIMFNGTNPGARYEFTPKYDETAKNFTSFIGKISNSLTSNGYNRKSDFAKLPIFIVSIISIMVTAVTLAVFTSTDGLPVGTLIFTIVGAFLPVVAMMMLIFVVSVKPLTTKGIELRDYIKGLDMYIKLAEKDRFKVLQSAEGALRATVDTSDKRQMVKLYERLLPYAVLLGHEKSWSKELETYYADTNTIPNWYVGVGAFNAATFSSTVSSFASSISSSSSSYSSSSGVGGGGFSGGGGGGGGGGGR